MSSVTEPAAPVMTTSPNGAQSGDSLLTFSASKDSVPPSQAERCRLYRQRMKPPKAANSVFTWRPE